MIKFFRKIRQNLLTENKFSKYLLYAIGEIILVVIGILIALQINTANEQHKLKQQELIYLHNFDKSLKKDLEEIKVSMTHNSKIKKSLILLIDYLEKDLPYQDSLKYHFGLSGSSLFGMGLNESIFESIKYNGLNVISNEDLSQKLIAIYGARNSAMQTHLSLYYNIIENAGFNIFNTRFESSWQSNYEQWKMAQNDQNILNVKIEMVPVDYNLLKEDQEYMYFLKSLLNRFNWIYEIQADGLKSELESLIKDIENELVILETK